MNYTIIGQDGKKYGPAGAEQVRQWIDQARAESRTPVFVEGTSDWTFLGLLPEFAAHFSGPPPTITVVPGAGQMRRTNQLAVWGLVCGILSWLACCCCCQPFNVLGLIFSIIALTQIRANPETQEGRGLAIAGLVLSITSLLWCLVFGILNVSLNSGAANAPFVWHMHSI